MHDHATEGGRLAFEAGASARELRIHLDNAHDERTSGLDHAHLAELHRKAHKGAEMEAAADQVIDQLDAAGAFGLYLTDANGTVYLASEVDPRHMPTPGPLYRLTAQVPPAERVVDLLEQTETYQEMVAAANARRLAGGDYAHGWGEFSANGDQRKRRKAAV